MKLKDITEDDIRELADSTAIRGRGIGYYEDGLVESFRVEGNRIIAKVSGSYGLYDTEVAIKNGEIDASCNCPYEGYGCKHIVAVLYKWLNEKDKFKTVKSKKCRKINLKRELSKLDKQKLVSLLLKFSEENEKIREELAIGFMKEDSVQNFPGRESILHRIKDALHAGDGFGYYQVPRIVGELDEIKQTIMKCPPNSRADLLKQLSVKCIDVFEYCDDSNGQMGDFIQECLKDCGKAISEQNLPFEEKKQVILENLAKYDKEEYGFEEGYLDMVMEIPKTGKDFDFLVGEIKNRISRKKDSYEGSAYRDILTEVYRRGKMDDEYLKMLTENMNKRKEFLPLAEFWKGKGNIKKAVEIAEEGMSANKRVKRNKWEHVSEHGIYEFLEKIYSSQKKEKDLLRVRFLYFEEVPSLSKYKDILKICKGKKNCNKIKQQLIKSAEGQELIEIYLFENELEKAFDALMASSEHYFDDFKNKVAKALVQKYPEKSLKIYFSLVEEFIGKAERDYYRVAALYAKSIKEILVKKLNKESEWNNYISRVREQNRRRPALIEEFSRL